MARDVQIRGGIGAAPQTYLVPNATEVIPRAINATFDGTAAAGGFLPTVEIISDGGVVVARCPCSTAVVAGGSAEVSFYPFSEDAVAVGVGYPAVVGSVGPPGTLRLYLRLGQPAAPFVDTSGYINGPSNATLVAGITPFTTQVPGALGAGQDDGAVQFNAPINGGQSLITGGGAINPGVNAAFTLAAWVKPSVSGSAWRGGIVASQGVVAGSPSHEEGWELEAEWSGGTVTAKMSRVINNVRLSASRAIPTGSWSFLVGTYDAANLRLYVNGALVATTADARADSAPNYGNITVDRIATDVTATIGQFYGVLDEVAMWGAVLTAANAAALYSAAF